MFNWTLKSIPIKELQDHSKNPRHIGKEQLKRLSGLLDKFGLIDKPIVNTDMTIICGHQRIRILKKKRVKNVECWIPDRELLPAEVDELLIGHNLHQGQWDFDMLANEWEPLDLLKYGFSEDQLLGTCKEAEEVLEKEVKAKSVKECPNCGHEF